MKRRWVSLLCLWLVLCLLPAAAIAQDDDPASGWPVVQRCVTSTARPEGWTFEGTILLEGYAGIHGVNDAWPTPRVLAQINWDWDQTVPGGAGLSPDGLWYAVLGGRIWWSQTYNFYFEIEEIQVYSTTKRGEVYVVPWDSYYMRNSGKSQMYWFDAQHLIYESWAREWEPQGVVVLNPFDGSTVPWKGKTEDVLYTSAVYEWETHSQYPAPDFTRVLSVRPLDRKPGLFDTMNDESLAEIDLSRDAYVTWMPDSSHFVVEIDEDPDEDIESRQLALFNRDGRRIDVLMTVPENERISLDTKAWSPDERYLAFRTVDRVEYDHNFYIADMQTRQIIDTCLNIGEGAAFSPDNTQLAVLAPGTGTKYVLVLDLEAWALHPVANHIVEYRGAVIGWREDESP